MKKLKIIVAVANNNAIGNKGKLLYTLKDDMKYFKAKTNGNVVIMGRKTFESIGNLFRTELILYYQAIK